MPSGGCVDNLKLAGEGQMSEIAPVEARDFKIQPLFCEPFTKVLGFAGLGTGGESVQVDESHLPFPNLISASAPNLWKSL